MRRRKFIASVGAVAMGFGAGCIAQGQMNPAGTDERTPSDQDVRPTVQGHRIETKETGCMSDDETGIVVTYRESTITIDGTAQTPTPCYRTYIENAVVADGTLRLRVGFERDDSELCTECVGAVRYIAGIDFDSTDGIDSVTVIHEETGNTFTETRSVDDTEASPNNNPKSTPLDDPESEPDPDLQVLLENEHTESHEIHVEIHRESGEAVYSHSLVISAGSERDVYNLQEASPDGVETFTITATMNGRSESIRVETSVCYGPVIVSVTDDGDLYPYYAIC